MDIFILPTIAFLLACLYAFLSFKKPGLALTTCLVPQFLMLFLAPWESAINEDIWVIAYSISWMACPIAVMVVGMTGKVADEPDRWPRVCARMVLTLFLYFVSLAILLAIFQPMGLIFWACLITFILRYRLSWKRATAAQIMSIISTSMKQNLPLVTALEAAGNGNDKRSRILRNIAKWHSQGYCISDAIRRGYPKCPSSAIAAITVAEKINQLPAAMDSIEAELVEQADQSKKVHPVSPAYPLIVALMAFSLMMGLLIFIIPTFAEVLSDMSDGTMLLPGPTLLLMDFAYLLMSFKGLTAISLVILIAAIAGTMAVIVRFRQRRPEAPYISSRIGDFIKWRLPILHWFELNYSILRVVSLLKTSLNAGCTVNNAIENTLVLDTNNTYRKRLKKWLTAVEQGQNVSDSARQAGIGKSVAWAFDDKVNQGNTPEVLEMLEEFYRNNYSYKANLARSMVWPGVIVLLGLMVGYISYAMFIPIVEIINYLAETALP